MATTAAAAAAVGINNKSKKKQIAAGGAAGKKKSRKVSRVAPKILLFYPNIVGYGRIVATVLAFSMVFTDYHWAAFWYLVGQGLDAVDGVTARFFQQTSRFGAVLDMLTDRMSTATLLVVLALVYQDAWGWFAFLIVLDIVSHWFHMYSKMAVGAKSHKGGSNMLLNFYYTFPYVLLVCCVGNEFYLVSLYLLSQEDFPINVFGHETGLVHLVSVICLPVFLFKQFMNLIQLWESIQTITRLDQQDWLDGQAAAAAAKRK